MPDSKPPTDLETKTNAKTGFDDPADTTTVTFKQKSGNGEPTLSIEDKARFRQKLKHMANKTSSTAGASTSSKATTSAAPTAGASSAYIKKPLSFGLKPEQLPEDIIPIGQPVWDSVTITRNQAHDYQTLEGTGNYRNLIETKKQAMKAWKDAVTAKQSALNDDLEDITPATLKEQLAALKQIGAPWRPRSLIAKIKDKVNFEQQLFKKKNLLRSTTHEEEVEMVGDAFNKQLVGRKAFNTFQKDKIKDIDNQLKPGWLRWGKKPVMTEQKKAELLAQKNHRQNHLEENEQATLKLKTARAQVLGKLKADHSAEQDFLSQSYRSAYRQSGRQISQEDNALKEEIATARQQLLQRLKTQANGTEMTTLKNNNHEPLGMQTGKPAPMPARRFPIGAVKNMPTKIWTKVRFSLSKIFPL